MKKIILSIFYAVWFAFYANAQLAILDSEMQDITNQNITVNGTANDNYFKVDIFLQNAGEEPVDVYVRKFEVELIEGVMNSFYWNGTSFSELVFDVEDPLILDGDQILRDTVFYTEFLTDDVEGLSEVRYEFFSQTESFDTVSLTILLNIETPTGFTDSDTRKSIHLADPQPNPARGFTWINYAVPAHKGNAQIVLRNLLGKQVHSENLDINGNRIRINTHNLTNGIYIYSLIIDSQVIESKRLVVAN